MHAAALNLEPSVVSHVGIATQQSDAAHVLVAHVTPVNVSFKWFFPATQEEEANSVPVPSMSSHVGFAMQQSDAAHTPVAHTRITPVVFEQRHFLEEEHCVVEEVAILKYK